MPARPLIPAIAAALASLATAPAQAAFTAEQCTAIARSAPWGVSVSHVEWVKAGKLPADPASALTGSSRRAADIDYVAHCVINGEMEKRTGTDGKPYYIGFQLRLPADWNGSFLYQGGGGMDGFIAPAVGSTPVRGSTATPALNRGYAVVTSDSGHQKPDTDFAADQLARVNYAYAATGKVTPVAKHFVRTAYGSQPRHSFYMGCSNGGRAGMMAAMRHTQEFDGIVAGNPGFRLSRAAVGEAWDNQHISAAAPGGIVANALTQQDLDAVVQGVLARCDAKDGLKDGIVNAWESCDFRPEMVKDQIGADKVKLLDTIFGGAKNSRGENVYSGWFYDAGINTEDWRAWKLGDSQTTTPNGRNFTLGASSLPNYFMTPRNPDFTWAQFNFDTDVAKTAQTAAINDAVSTDLGSFKANGGKMIVFEGVSDPVFSAVDLRDWYRQLLADTSGARDAVRLFNVPGMTHCGGGAALDDFDPLTALEQWHATGKAPDSMVAKGKAFPGKSQPLCAYPAVATYVKGDENSAGSFSCK
ncbi:MAG: tannase/feruloyl esterase family alpha/beta hydrolase [Lautropia sp.]|nr:tannase/feruloyl esterase family alpha/beta hydrolase [Lautropia sp.]